MNALEEHSHCLLCGKLNPRSLKLSFKLDDDGCVGTFFKPGLVFQGYDGILHGRAISALLDSSMTHCLFLNNIRAVTADLRIRFVKPVPCNTCIYIRAYITSSKFSVYGLRAEILSEGRILAWAQSKFVDFPERKRP